MNRLKISIYIVSIIAAHVSISRGAPVVIAGSELNAPPAFWENSYSPLGPSIDRAFSR